MNNLRLGRLLDTATTRFDMGVTEMTKSIMQRTGLGALTLAVALAIAATPYTITVADNAIAVKSVEALAKKGADDPAGHVRGGGKGRGRGADDGANHR